MKLWRSYSLIITLALVGLVSCSSNTGPAPVVLLNSQQKNKLGKNKNLIYTVKKGDTLYSIAWIFGKDYRTLATYNNINSPYTLYVGQKLRLTKPAHKTKARSNTIVKSDPNTLELKSNQEYGKRKEIVNTVKKASSPSHSKKSVEDWRWPAKGKIINRFSAADAGNKGIDIQSSRGTPIVASADGKVVYAGSALRGYGKLIIVKHTDSILSAYAHNDTIIVKEQQWVKSGQKIATMGSSGTDKVKLHFEIRYRGKSLDPLRYLDTQNNNNN